MARNLILKLALFIILWIVGAMFFGQFGDAAGTSTSMLFIGESIIGSNLDSDAGSLTSMIVSFIITAVIYYLVAELITLILTKIIGKRD